MGSPLELGVGSRQRGGNLGERVGYHENADERDWPRLGYAWTAAEPDFETGNVVASQEFLGSA